MSETFSKGQRVTGEYRGHGFTGVITSVKPRVYLDSVVSVKLDVPIQVRGERGQRDKFMTSFNESGDFTAAVQGFMATEVHPETAPEDFGVMLETEPAPQDAQPAAWYTDPVTTADGEQIKARVTRVDGGYTIEVLANGIEIPSERRHSFDYLPALSAAVSGAVAYVHECNRQRAIEMGNDTETPASNYPTPETPRIQQLRAHIDRLQREMDSYTYELAQLVGDE